MGKLRNARKACSSYAVTKITPGEFSFGEALRTSKPSVPGICTSRNTRSGENSQRVQVGSPASQAKLEHVPFTSARNVEVNATSSNSERAHANNDIDIGVPSLQMIDGDLLFSYSLD
jgi:hypothetical protein